MEIEDVGELRKFETMPNEGTLYLSLVRYESGGWMNGPCSMDKNEVMRMLGNWAGAKAARIYAVKVPIDAMPAA